MSVYLLCAFTYLLCVAASERMKQRLPGAPCMPNIRIAYTADVCRLRGGTRAATRSAWA